MPETYSGVPAGRSVFHLTSPFIFRGLTENCLLRGRRRPFDPRVLPQEEGFVPATCYCNFAYSALACFRMGMSGSASFQRVRKSL
jgi:hypothetical protein